MTEADWRLQGQDRFLKGAIFEWRRYTKYRSEWDHDHCEFCGKKFSELPADLNVGYATLDERC